MNDSFARTGAVIAIVIAVIAAGIAIWKSDSFGASGTRFPNGISADTTSPVAGEVRGTDLTITDDATVSGGNLTVTTSNAATSTTAVGCIQTVATSTATPIRLLLYASSTIAAASSFGAYAQLGFVTYGYGTCPI